MRETRRFVGMLVGALLLAQLGVGCARRRSVAYVEDRVEIVAGLIQVRSPIRLAITTDREETSEDGVASHLRIWEGRTPVYGMVIASIERASPFTGPRDRILEGSMGDQIRGGSLGEVTYDYSDGIFTARADAVVEGGSVRVRAFMSQRRLAVVVCGGRAEPVALTMDSIDVRAAADELFFLSPGPATSSAMHVVWGLGFSCRMPGGVTVDQSARGSMRYSATGNGYDVQAFVYAEEDPLDVQRTRAVGRGTLIEEADSFDGGLRVRRLLVRSPDAHWHAWLLTPLRAFHIQATGDMPSARDREAIEGFFASCTF